MPRWAPNPLAPRGKAAPLLPWYSPPSVLDQWANIDQTPDRHEALAQPDVRDAVPQYLMMQAREYLVPPPHIFLNADKDKNRNLYLKIGRAHV